MKVQKEMCIFRDVSENSANHNKILKLRKIDDLNLST